VKFVAELGFAGMMHPWALGYSSREIEEFADAARDYGIEGSCVVIVPRDLLGIPMWGEPLSVVRDKISTLITAASTLASRIYSRTIAAIATASPDRSIAVQKRNMQDNLAFAADIAASHEKTIVVETMRTLPNMLLSSTEALLDVIRRTGHPSAKVAFDTHHVASLDGIDRVQTLFVENMDQIALLQLANYPEKTEVGAGQIDFTGLLAEAMRCNFHHLVELEHIWSQPGLAGEKAGFARFRAVDAEAQSRAFRTQGTLG
jgi:hydroxypyruvate isomerase